MMTNPNPRALAAHILLQVLENNRSLTAALAAVLVKNNQAGLTKELSFGVCRWYFRLTALADKLLAKPLRAKDHDVYLLILIGLYQILYLRVPEHAAVLETVEAARSLKKPWATRLINAILRGFLRQQANLLAIVDNTLLGRYAHPSWMVESILAAWPQAGKAILEANNQRPPLTLRVNCLQTSVADYLKSLDHAGIAASTVADAPWALVLQQAQEVAQLPGFYSGQFSVQDSAAQLVAPLLLLEPGQRVLDACAAPGGKTTHILESEPHLRELVALDKEAGRVVKIEENIKRLGLTGKVRSRAVDATQTVSWWDGECFDRILIDAPCSGTGVIRRHPDIKVLRKLEDITALAQQQQALLAALWPVLKPGGMLLYTTCSILPEENEGVVQQFLDVHPDACEQKIVANWGIAKQVGRQIVASQENHDGFYYARLLKTR